MLKIDDKFLDQAGLADLPPAEKEQLKSQVYESLESRVGMKLAAQMNDNQLDEFEKFIDHNDETGALKWLEVNFPEYPKLVKAELDTLQAELKADAPKIKDHLRATGDSATTAG